MAKAKKRRRTKVAAKRAPVARKRTTRAPRPAPAPVTDVVANLTHARNELSVQRDSLDEQITMIDKALTAMGTRPTAMRMARRGAAPAGRGPRAGSLKEFIVKVLSGRKGAMAVKDISAGVLKAGYTTRNKTLAKSVGIALTQMPQIVKVGRGLFKMK